MAYVKSTMDSIASSTLAICNRTLWPPKVDYVSAETGPVFTDQQFQGLELLAPGRDWASETFRARNRAATR
jgi:hypothetical protein